MSLYAFAREPVNHWLVVTRVDWWGQYRERTGVPARAARVGWWMRPGRGWLRELRLPDCYPVATALGTDLVMPSLDTIARFWLNAGNSPQFI